MPSSRKAGATKGGNHGTPDLHITQLTIYILYMYIVNCVYMYIYTYIHVNYPDIVGFVDDMNGI